MSTEDVLEALRIRAKVPALACAIGSSKGVGRFWYCGRLTDNSNATNVSRETVFDLASLTKVLTTHQWVLRLVSAGKLALDAPVSKYMPGASAWLAACPIWRLANHTSGLAAHVRFYETTGPSILRDGNFLSAYDNVIDQILNQVQKYPTGSEQLYSDLGYILLAHICGRVDGAMPERVSSLYGHGPIGVHWRQSQQYPPKGDIHQYAATEQCPWRNRLIQGEVHDDNCWSMGGIAGHAGSFGTLEAVHRLSCAWLAALKGNTNPLGISKHVIKGSLSSQYGHFDRSRILGWDRTAESGSCAGDFFTPNSYGHLGFTGTSIWLDVEQDIAVTLLTNRVSPSRDNLNIRWLRPSLHNHLRSRYSQCLTT
jgi:serine-type D-Ala-D-Ala carboxypeptidase